MSIICTQHLATGRPGNLNGTILPAVVLRLSPLDKWGAQQRLALPRRLPNQQRALVGKPFSQRYPGPLEYPALGCQRRPHGAATPLARQCPQCAVATRWSRTQLIERVWCALKDDGGLRPVRRSTRLTERRQPLAPGL
jgi:hypothetical protein